MINGMRSRIREYQNMFWILREHEGRRAARWPLAATGLVIAVWAFPFAGGIASFYLVKSGDSFPVVALSVVVTLGLGAIGASWSSRRPWYALLADRVFGYEEQTDSYAYARGCIALADRERALHALRRAGLQARTARSPGPADAPELGCRMEIYRPRNCTKPGLEAVNDQALRVLDDLGVEGRVGSRDVRTGRDIWTREVAAVT
jgi:hypothetical protein